jgi:hypothetical protein
MLQAQIAGPVGQLQAQLAQRGAVSAATANRTAAEEPLFLDEPADYAGRGRGPESESPMDLFADENDLRSRTAWVGTQIRSGAPAHASVPAATLPRLRPTLLAGMSLVAALTALATVQACGIYGAQSLGFGQFFR